MSLPDAVFLDMDGTLVDTEPLWLATVTEVAGSLGVVVADLEPFRGLAVDATADLLGAPAARERLESGFLRRVRADLVVLPGTRELLRLLASLDVPAVLVTASPRSVVAVVLEVLGADAFALTVTADDTVLTKPHPDPYLVAAAGVGADPARSIAVEDSLPGIAAARAAGLHVLLAPAAPVSVHGQRLASLADIDLELLTTCWPEGALPATS